MNRFATLSLSLILAGGITACSGGTSNPTNSALSLAGTWTVATVSTQGHGNSTGTATITQTGQGLGVTGTTNLAAPIGQMSIAQTGTTLSGTITSGSSSVTFTGTLSNGSFTATGSYPCTSKVSESTTLTGTVTSTTIQGNYTITRGSGCYYPSDAGTFTGTKK